jgi:hypothetical protein
MPCKLFERVPEVNSTVDLRDAALSQLLCPFALRRDDSSLVPRLATFADDGPE